MFNVARKQALKAAKSDDLNDARRFRPAWVQEDIWNELIDHWTSESWQHKSKVASENRMTLKDGSIAKHTGGSKSFASHKRDMVNIYFP